MRSFVYIDFASTPLKPRLQRLLSDLDITESNTDVSVIGSYFGVRLRSEDPRVEKLLARLKELPFDAPVGIRREIDYDREDLEAAEFLVVWITRAEKGETGPIEETEYDLSTACPECGTGAKQISPLRISPSALPKKSRVAQTYSHQALVEEGLATELKIELRSDRGLRQVEARRILHPLPWWQILPDTYMPPLATETRGLGWLEGCPRCKRDGFGHELENPFEPVYRMTEEERRSLPDFVFTWEHLGVSRLKWAPGMSIRLAYPSTLISNRVLRVFLREKIKGIKFIPVRFI